MQPQIVLDKNGRTRIVCPACGRPRASLHACWGCAAAICISCQRSPLHAHKEKP